ncbi:MAG: F0F1 ATP synthase subunit delta [Bacilli bacterium]
MNSSTLSNRYAEALLSIAKEKGLNTEFRNYIKELVNAINENKEIISILSSSFIAKEEKKNIISKILSTCPYMDIVSLVMLIIDNRRENYLLSILNEFISISNEEDNISEGYVYVAEKLSEKQLEAVQLAISKKLNKEVFLYQRIDESLIGGIKVVISDYVFDASIKHKLDSLKNTLQERG